MTKEQALKLASGYAWGTEDASGVKTAVPAGDTSACSGDYLFAQAFAQAQDDYNQERAGMMPSVGHAYAIWRNTGGTSVTRWDAAPVPAFRSEAERRSALGLDGKTLDDYVLDDEELS